VLTRVEFCDILITIDFERAVSQEYQNQKKKKEAEI
jgi:hypothetical protein